VTENYLACARESVPIVVTSNSMNIWCGIVLTIEKKNHNLEESFLTSLLLTVVWQFPRPYKIIQIKKSEYYSRLKLNGIEFGFFSEIFSFLSAQPTHKLLFRSHNPISKTKLTKKKSSRV
jgi:hypothetical protein